MADLPARINLLREVYSTKSSFPHVCTYNSTPLELGTEDQYDVVVFKIISGGYALNYASKCTFVPSFVGEINTFL